MTFDSIACLPSELFRKKVTAHLLYLLRQSSIVIILYNVEKDVTMFTLKRGLLYSFSYETIKIIVIGSWLFR